MANIGMLIGCGKFIERNAGAGAGAGGQGLVYLDDEFPSDEYGTIQWAFSMRKLISTYSGSALRVRRISDDSELDIEYGADGWIDTDSMLSFCAGTDGYVVTWYNQGSSGSDGDCSQSTASLQPLIVSSGSLQLALNERPTMFFSNDRLYSASGGWTSNNAMRYVVVKGRSTPYYHWKKIIIGSPGVEADVHFRATTNIIRHFYHNGAHDFVETPLLDDWKLIGACRLASGSSLMKINSTESSGSVGAQVPAGIDIGRGGFNYPGTHDMPEAFCFIDTDHTFEQMSLIETFMDDAYAIL